jgi:hypothetical protein
MAQMAEYPAYKNEAINSNPSTTTTIKKKY